MAKAFHHIIIFCFVLMLTACASKPSDPEALAEYHQINDPLEPTNRAIHSFNQVLDKNIMIPVVKGYRYVVPEFGRNRIHDFLSNLRAPLVLIHDILQGEFTRAGQTFYRFVLNTTAGVGGLFDVASAAGVPAHSEDAGQTLAAWGIGEGPYLELPLMGPSNPRDTAGIVIDFLIDPVGIILEDETDDRTAQYALTGIKAIDSRDRMLDLTEELKASSLDYYATLRTVYRQNREKEIANGSAPEEQTEESYDFDMDFEDE